MAGRRGQGLTTPSGFPHVRGPVISVLPVSSQSSTQQEKSRTFPLGRSASTWARPVARLCMPGGQGHALWSQISLFPIAALPSQFLVLEVSACAALGSHKFGPTAVSGLWGQTDLDSGLCHLLTWESF